jgi:hypothetical protein
MSLDDAQQRSQHVAAPDKCWGFASQVHLKRDLRPGPDACDPGSRSGSPDLAVERAEDSFRSGELTNYHARLLCGVLRLRGTFQEGEAAQSVQQVEHHLGNVRWLGLFSHNMQYIFDCSPAESAQPEV